MPAISAPGAADRPEAARDCSPARPQATRLLPASLPALGFEREGAA
jgi:hypothetical protein